MSVSQTTICNLALQMLGEPAITSITESSPKARHFLVCYDAILAAELRAHVWNFAKSRANPALSGVTPAFDYDYAFIVPDDFLRVILPANTYLDWKVERHDSDTCILTNEGSSIDLTYIALVTDPTKFDPLFVIAFAASLAEHLCEPITQSTDKKQYVAAKRREAIAQARRTNAIENVAQEAAEDTWSAVRL